MIWKSRTKGWPTYFPGCSGSYRKKIEELVKSKMGEKVVAIEKKKERPPAKDLMDALRLIATVSKNTNVLLHIMGYFKRDLEHVEKEELREIIERYRRGLIPLIVPVTLLNHYVLKYDQPYLKNQYYLNPHPVELMLRNHV
jgi:uncharacterized protein YbgA (DUF1722 family)